MILSCAGRPPADCPSAIPGRRSIAAWRTSGSPTRSRAGASPASPTGAPTSSCTRARPRGRAEGRARAPAGAADPPGPHGRPHLPQAVDAHADQLRGRDRRARRDGALRPRRRSPALARGVDARHRARPLALPERDHDPHVRPGRGRRVRGARDDPDRQRPHRRVPPAPGARRRDDDPGALRHARGRPRRLPRRRQQRLPLADADRGQDGDASRRRVTRGLPARPRGRRPRAARTRRRAAGASRSSSTRPRRSPGARVLYTDVWTSMGQEDEHERRLRDLAPYRIDDEKLAARGARTPSRSTACRHTSARRSPRTSSTATARSSGTRPRTACTSTRRSSRSRFDERSTTSSARRSTAFRPRSRQGCGTSRSSSRTRTRTTPTCTACSRASR